MGYFLQGLMMGFAYVAPIGLQNMFFDKRCAGEHIKAGIADGGGGDFF